MTESDPTRKIDENIAKRLHRALTANSDELFQVLQDPAMDESDSQAVPPLLKAPE